MKKKTKIGMLKMTIFNNDKAYFYEAETESAKKIFLIYKKGYHYPFFFFVISSFETILYIKTLRNRCRKWIYINFLI